MQKLSIPFVLVRLSCPLFSNFLPCNDCFSSLFSPGHLRRGKEEDLPFSFWSGRRDVMVLLEKVFEMVSFLFSLSLSGFVFVALRTS